MAVRESAIAADLTSNPPFCDRVAAHGVYSGTYKATCKSMRAAFAHLYEGESGKTASMTQYVDTFLVQQALTPDA